MGAPKKDRPASDVIDLDAMLAGRSLAPKLVRFAGHTYQVRTDISPAEVVQYHVLAGKAEDQQAFQILVGDDSLLLDQTLDATPKAHQQLIISTLLNATGCFAGLVLDPEADAAGEPSAS